MAEGLSTDLLVAAFVVGVPAFVLSLRVLPPGPALGIVTIRLVLFVLYFSLFYDGTWTFLDDRSYARFGRLLLERGFDPWTIWLEREGLGALLALAGGQHVLYVWWNLLAQWLFGPFYFAPVALNLLATFVAAYALQRIASLAGYSGQYSRWLFVFLVLHWDIVTWSTLLNLKDILVMALTLVGFWIVLLISRRDRGSRIPLLLSLLVVLTTFLFLRFYVPVLMLAAVATWLVLTSQIRARSLFILLAFAGVTLATLEFGPQGLRYIEPSGVLVGLVRSLLTPQPWSIEPAYAFLFLPSLLHWLLLPLMLTGGWILWRSSTVGRLFIVYFAIAILFYAIVPELQGPRQRVQLVPFLAWFQFQALYALAGETFRSLHRPAPRVAEA